MLSSCTSGVHVPPAIAWGDHVVAVGDVAFHVVLTGGVGVHIGLSPVNVPVPLNVNDTDMLPVSDARKVPVALVVNAKLDDPDIAPGAPPDNVPEVVKAGEIIPTSLPVALSTPAVVKSALVAPDRTPAPRIAADVVNAGADVPVNAPVALIMPLVVNAAVAVPDAAAVARPVAVVLNVTDVAPCIWAIPRNIPDVENVTATVPVIAPPDGATDIGKFGNAGLCVPATEPITNERLI